MVEGVDLAQRRLVVAANRGPVSFHDDPSGEPVVTRGPGGLVTVLTEVLRHHPGTWVAAALGDEERRLAVPSNGRSTWTSTATAYQLRYVDVDPVAYNKYYNVVANPMLWFIQHYLWDLGRHPDIGAEELDAWHNGYLVVNEQFAQVPSSTRCGAVPTGACRRGHAGDGDDALVLLHDYQLYCVAPQVRGPRARTPFCTSSSTSPGRRATTGACCPVTCARPSSAAFSATTSSRFHTLHYARNFLRCCEDLLELDVDLGRRSRAVRRA